MGGTLLKYDSNIKRQYKKKINKFYCIKIKNLHGKSIIVRVKRPPANWKKIFATYTTDKKLISLMCMYMCVCTYYLKKDQKSTKKMRKKYEHTIHKKG